MVHPTVNQVELHPFYPQTSLVEFCRSKGILVAAYSPMGRGHPFLLKDENVLQVRTYMTGIPSMLMARMITAAVEGRRRYSSGPRAEMGLAARLHCHSAIEEPGTH